MRDIRVSDITMREAIASKALSLSFKEKLEIVKILDRIGVGSIEVEGIESSKVDSLRIKSIASLVKNSTLAVPVKMDGDSIQAVWNAAKGAKRRPPAGGSGRQPLLHGVHPAQEGRHADRRRRRGGGEVRPAHRRRRVRGHRRHPHRRGLSGPRHRRRGRRRRQDGHRLRRGRLHAPRGVRPVHRRPVPGRAPAQGHRPGHLVLQQP